MRTYLKSKYKLLAVALFFCLNLPVAFSQKVDLKAIADSIQNEGRMLYLSEMASWHGTDIFLDKLKTKRELIGGYISYDTGKGVNNVFVAKGADKLVLSTIKFGYDFDLNNYKIDTMQRKLTAEEEELFEMRKRALNALNTDTLFKYYKNASFNVIPVINKNMRRTYVLTSPKSAGVIILGNDYMLDFDKNNVIVNKRKIHRNLLPFQTKVGDNQTSAVHNHLPETGDFITVTDVCTLMLYRSSTGWNSHVVASESYLSLWDMKKGGLAILTRKAWDKINATGDANKPIPKQ